MRTLTASGCGRALAKRSAGGESGRGANAAAESNAEASSSETLAEAWRGGDGGAEDAGEVSSADPIK